MKLKRFLILIFVFLLIGVGGFFLVNNFGRAGIASLEVNSNAKLPIFINGEKTGTGSFTGTYDPKLVTVQVGNYETQVQLQNGVRTIIDREFSVDGQQSSGEVVSFQPTGLPNGTVAVVSAPTEAEIVIDNIPRGETPLNISGLTSGNHQFLVSANNYTSRKFSINVVKGYKLIAAIDLSPTAPENTKNTDTKTELNQAFVEILSTPNDFLRVHEKPTIASNEIARVHTGEKYQLITTDKASGWYNIQLTASASGWISNTYAATASASTQTPIP
jgi:hypothetical protein